MNDVQSFADDFSKLCEELSDKIMITYDVGYAIKRFTYYEVMQLCHRYMAVFRRCGLKCGDTVIGIMPNSPEAIICFFSTMMAGLNYAPLPCSVTKREYNHWKEIVKPALVIKKEGIAEYAMAPSTMECSCDGDLSWLGTDEYDMTLEKNGARIYLMTSGTTGTPKAMSIDAERLWQSGTAFVEYYHLENSGLRFWNYLPMSYLGGLFNLALIPLCCKGSFVISEPFSGKTILNFWNYIQKHDITAIWFVPSIVQGLLKILALVGKNMYADICKNVKVSFLGTAPINYQQKEEFEKKFGLRLYENFALSETTFITAEKDEDIRFRESGSVGSLLPYVSMKIVPTEGTEGGGIWVKTPFLFSGYLSKDGLEQIDVDSEGYFNTKDLGHYNEDGVLVLDGRDRDIIKKGGLFVNLTEIERAVMEYQDIEEAVAVSFAHDFYGESFYLFVKLKDNCDRRRSVKEIYAWMLDNFVQYKMPEKIIPVDDFPKTSSGKIKKQELLAFEEG